jgi:hypothetical protein
MYDLGRVRRLFWAPTGTEAAELLLAAWLIVRGVGVLLWNGLSGAGASPMYCYALHLAPEWVWGALPLVVGVAWAWALFCCHDARRVVALAAVWYFVAWSALLAVGRPDVSVLAYVGPLLVMAVVASWAWLLHGWTRDGAS